MAQQVQAALKAVMATIPYLAPLPQPVAVAAALLAIQIQTEITAALVVAAALVLLAHLLLEMVVLEILHQLRPHKEATAEPGMLQIREVLAAVAAERLLPAGTAH